VSIAEREPGIDEAAEYSACECHPGYFVHTYGVIDDAQDIGPGETPTATMPFHLWPSQWPVVETLWSGRQVVVLKARQLGISWLVCGYILWRCLFLPGQVGLIFSKGQKEANELVRRIKAMYDRLPAWLKATLPRLVTPNVRELRWSNGSWITSMPATRNAGVSYKANFVVLDEFAHMPWPGELFLNVQPTVDAGGQFFIISTANGVSGPGGPFHRIWSKAEAGENTFQTVFLPWWARPGRDAAWYARVRADADDPKAVPQNYPANPLEAFLVSGRTRFDADWIAAQSANVVPGMPEPSWPAPLRAIPARGLVVYSGPLYGREYLIGADVAEGKLKGPDDDYSCGVVIDAESWEEVATLHGRWEPDEFAKHLIALSDAYSTDGRPCPVAVERNNHGHAVIATWKVLRFPAARIGLGEDGFPGWSTTPRSKPMGVDLLAASLRDRAVTIRTRATLREMQTFGVLPSGELGAQSGSHDDRVTMWWIALAYSRHRRSLGGNRTVQAGRNVLAGYRG
jgi:hypothetical protein